MGWEREAAAAARAEADIRDRERAQAAAFGDRASASRLAHGANALRAHAKRLDKLEALRCEARGHDRARRLLVWILRRRKTK